MNQIIDSATELQSRYSAYHLLSSILYPSKEQHHPVSIAEADSISFSVDLRLSGLSSPVLDQSGRNAVSKAVALVMNISEAYVSYADLLLEDTTTAAAEAKHTVNVYNYPTEGVSEETTYNLLSTRFNESASKFDTYLHDVSTTLGANMTKFATMQSYSIQFEPVQEVVSEGPTSSPVNPNTSGLMSSPLKTAAGLPLWVIIAVLAFLLIIILLSCCCFFAPSSMCDSLFLFCCSDMFSKDTLDEVEMRRRSYTRDSTPEGMPELELDMTSIYGDGNGKKKKHGNSKKSSSKGKRSHSKSSKSSHHTPRDVRASPSAVTSVIIPGAVEEPLGRYVEHFDY